MKFAFLASACVTFLLTACETTTTSTESACSDAPRPTKVPDNARPAALPANVEVVTPEPSVPDDIAAFSGIWDGSWLATGLDSKLAVVRVNADGNASVVYAWGGDGGSQKPGHVRVSAQIAGSELYVPRFPNGAEAGFEFRRNDDLHGTYRTKIDDCYYAFYGRFAKRDGI
jgi:hypothetical protein